MSDRGIHGHTPGCSCTYEEGDSDCVVHPTCSDCGAEYSGRLRSRVAQLEAALRTAIGAIDAFVYKVDGYDVRKDVLDEQIAACRSVLSGGDASGAGREGDV